MSDSQDSGREHASDAGSQAASGPGAGAEADAGSARRAGIRIVGPEEATGALAELYATIASPDGTIDNIMLVHGLRPHTLRGHMELYKAVLHHPRNAIPRWFLELLGVYASALNRCDYCVDHHAAGLARLVGQERAEALRAAAEADDFGDLVTDRERAGLAYARTLTVEPGAIGSAHLAALRDAGYDDGEILEIDQVVAYFAYANRTVLGLTVSTAGDVLGTSPSGEGWAHR